MAGWYKLSTRRRRLDINSGAYRIADNIELPDARSGWRGQLVVHITGDSHREVHGALEALRQALRWGSDDDPLTLEYAPAMAIPTPPIWGQGIRRYEIIRSGMTVNDYTAYGSAGHATATIAIETNPYVLGQEQIAMSFSGVEDRLASPTLRGLIAAPATTNLIANPVFQYEAYGTWYGGWSSGAEIWQERDRRYVLFGHASCGLIATTPPSVLTCSVAAPNTNAYVLSCYAKRGDGGVINSSVVALYYGGEVTTTYQALPDGWYRLYASVTGSTSATLTGVTVKQKRELYLTGFQFEERSTGYPTPLTLGDDPGASWSGTPHNSTSTRSAGYLTREWQTLLRGAQYVERTYIQTLTLRLAFRWYYPSTYGETQYIAHGYPFSFLLYYNAADDRIYLGAASTSALTFAAGDLAVLHVVLSPGSSQLYINGQLAATGGDLGLFTNQGLYLGSDNTPGNHGCMTFLDAALWDYAAAADEIAADYADVYQRVTSGDAYGQPAYGIPWQYGSQCYPYQGSGNRDYVLIGGVAGDMPARSKLHISTAAGGNSILLAHNAYPVPPGVTDLFKDVSGSALSGALGGQVETQSVNTNEITFPSGVAYQISLARDRAEMYRRTAYLYAVLTDAGSNLTARPILQFSSSYRVVGDYQALAADGTLRKFLLGPLTIPDGVDSQQAWLGYQSAIEAFIGFVRTASGAANVSLDYYRLLVGAVAYIAVQSSDTRIIVINGDRADGLTATGNAQTEVCAYRGDRIELEPGEYNALTIIPGTIGQASNLSVHATLLYTWITPRWSGI